MTEIYLVRHGQTEWNREAIFRGTTDVPLNDSGIEEAGLAAEALRRIAIEAVYSSPLARARQTAEPIARVHGLDLRIAEGLMDLCFGEWQGVSYQAVREKYPDLYRAWREAPHTIAFPGGESLAALQTRAVGAVREIVCHHPDGTIAMVSHRVVNRVLICGLVGIDLARFWQIGQDTTAINRLIWREGRFILSCLNDTCHLRAMEAKGVKADS
jgi:broad specificity phosphatase PhoE